MQWYSAMEEISNSLNTIQSEFLIQAYDNDLWLAVEKLNLIYSDCDKEKVAQEVKRFLQHVYNVY